MSDSTVWVYAMENRPEITTDQKICDILSRHFSARSHPLQEDPVVQRDSRGKPFLANLPQWHISVSHSGNRFLCAVSPVQIGIDVQEHKLMRGETGAQAASRYCKIARRFFHPAEAAYVAQSPHENFFSVWTAKESYVKYTGQGMDSHFDTFCVIPKDSKVLPAGIPWQASQVSFQQLLLDAEYTFCMCTKQPCALCWEQIT